MDKMTAEADRENVGHEYQLKAPFTSLISAVATGRRVDALFRSMSTDYLLREQFVTDPAQVLSEYVNGTRISPDRASVGNQLLYSVMASPGLLRWLTGYADRSRRSVPSRNQFAADFGRAVVEHGNHHVVVALLRSSIERHDVFAPDEPLLQIMLHGLWQGDDDPGTGGGEGTGPGTDPGTGGGGGTDPGTGTGTGGGEGTGPAEGDFGFFGRSYVQVTLQALVQFATHLRNIGALDVIGRD